MALDEQEKIKEARRAYRAEWRKKNREKIRAYEREWAKKNPEKIKAANERYWLKKAANKGGGNGN